MFEIMLSRGYNEVAFREDLKSLFNQLGVEDKKLVFMFTASQVAEEGFLEIINNILTVGQVPALFGDDDKDTIINSCRNASKDAGFGITKYEVILFLMSIFKIYF